RALFALAGESRKRQQDDEQRDQQLHHRRGGQFAESLQGYRVLRRAELEFILLVRLQPDRLADEWIDAAVERRGRHFRLESIEAVMGRRMRVLGRLAQPLIARFGPRQIVLAFDVAVMFAARDDALDATDWFVNAKGLPRAPFHQNQFGGTVGGPVRLPGYDG